MDATDLNKNINQTEEEENEIDRRQATELTYEPEQTLINSVHVDDDEAALSHFGEEQTNEESGQEEEALNDTRIIGGSHEVQEAKPILFEANDNSNKDQNLDAEYFNRKRLEEEYQKELYYRSNPLRKFIGSTQGQSILPLKSRVYSNKKKGLPTIFSELRLDDAEDIQVDRDVHKKGLRTTLKLNLKALEIDKSSVDSMEKSKQVYSEYCRYNLTKPLDMSNVESVFKSNLKKKTNASNSRLRRQQHPTQQQQQVNLNSTMSTNTQNTTTNDSSLSSDESGYYAKQQQQQGKKVSSQGNREDLEINAHTVKYKDIQEMNRDMRQHKQQIAKSKTADSKNAYVHVKYSAATTGKEHIPMDRGANKFSTQSSNNNRHLMTLNHYHVQQEQHQQPEQIYTARSDESEANKIDFTRHQSIASSEYGAMVPHPLPMNHMTNPVQNSNSQPIHLAINNIQAGFNGPNSDSTMAYNSGSYLPLYMSQQTPNAETRYRSRVNKARDKILHGSSEKTNLNKMTILQPFEDTKILINIDNVSSKILNNLLNKQQTNTPRFYMPPIRSYGYFKKVTEVVDVVDHHHRAVSSSAKRPSAKPRAKF